MTLPLIRPALMVAVIFRALDALRIFDLIYVLTPNNVQTKSMSVFARENLFEFDKFAYGSAASTLLFLILALLTILYLWLGRVNLDGAADAMPIVKRTGRSTSLVAVIVVVAVFPFYYAIITSLKTGTALFADRLLADDVLARTTTRPCSARGTFPRNLLNSLFIATCGGRSRCSSASPRPTRWRASASAAARCCS